MCSYVQRKLFYNGKVENWIILLDICGKGILNFPFKMLIKLISLTAVNFRNTLFKIFILNPSISLNTSWNIIKGVIDPDTITNINILNSKNFHQMFEFIDKSQLEIRHGGTAPNIEEG